MDQATPISVFLIGETLQLEHLSLLHDGWDATLATPSDITAGDLSRYEILVVDANLASDIDIAGARRAGLTSPILYLTDQDMPGITAHGDSFLTRPYSLEQMAASLRHLARHAVELRGDRPDHIIQVGELTLNEETLEVRRGDTVLTLTITEYELLRYFMRRPERVLSKAQILDHVWPVQSAVKPTVVELYTSYLRKRIDGGFAEPMLLTVRGAGYRLKAATS